MTEGCPSAPDQRRRYCDLTHTAARAFMAMQHVAARTERLLGAALRGHGLSMGQFAALVVVGENAGLTQQDLAERLGLGKANVSQVLDRLETAGLVQRVPSARAYALHPTAAGLDLLEATVPALEQRIDDQFAALSPGEQEQLHALLLRLVEASPAELPHS